MSLSFPVPYRDPATRQIKDGSVSLNLGVETVIDRDDPRVVISASGGSVVNKLDITQIINSLVRGKRTNNAFEQQGKDGFARLTAKVTSGAVLTVAGGPQSTVPQPAYLGIATGFPNGSLAIIFDGIDGEGQPVTPEGFEVASTSESGDASTITAEAAFSSTHYEGAVVKRINFADLWFLFYGAGLSNGESYQAQKQKPTAPSASLITLADGGSQTITITASALIQAWGFTPYFDVYCRKDVFYNIGETWWPDYTTDQSPPTQLRDLTLAEMQAGVTIGTYGGGTDAYNGGALAAGNYWVGVVVKDGGHFYNTNESLPLVQTKTIA